ncbi:MAG: FAD-dependent oxidoreductase [Bacteroidota bacterium]
MKRRRFLRNTALATTLPFWMQRCESVRDVEFPVHIHSDQPTGHLVFESLQWKRGTTTTCDIAIVGGGLAGLAAAYDLKNEDFRLFELSDRLGGTSASVGNQGFPLCQGAHYDLDYPEYYGEDVLGLLEELKIVQYQPWKKAWSFVDQQYIIPAARRQQCSYYGQIQEDVIPEGPTKAQFLDILSAFDGEMTLPTRMISEDLQYLNEVTFLDFLKSRMQVSSDFERQLDYHMMDDYGGTTAQVSALAGIHYFSCRPYYLKPVSLFSPPRGNDYFVQKISGKLPQDRIHLNHLIRRIEHQGGDFILEVVDVVNQQVHTVRANQVVYAGQKHALKHIFPSEYPLFEHNRYAPWLVINFVCKPHKGRYGYWQNEFVGEEPSFLGFIDSSVQDPDTLGDHRVFTAYYCLKPEDREYLSQLGQESQRVTAETLDYIRTMIPDDIVVERAFVNVMGHAMPIPQTGYLFNDANHKKSKLTYAGVDNGRLPLLFEALDSGLMASAMV